MFKPSPPSFFSPLFSAVNPQGDVMFCTNQQWIFDLTPSGKALAHPAAHSRDRAADTQMPPNFSKYLCTWYTSSLLIPLRSFHLFCRLTLSCHPFFLKKKEAKIALVTLRSHAAKQQTPWDSDPAALQWNLPLVSSSLALMDCEFQLRKTQRWSVAVARREAGPTLHSLPF